MEYYVDSATHRIVSGTIMAVVGVALLVAGYVYRHDQDWSEADPLAEPFLEGLSLLFTLMPLASVVGGLAMVGWGLRRAARERRESVGTVHRGNR